MITKTKIAVLISLVSSLTFPIAARCDDTQLNLGEYQLRNLRPGIEKTKKPNPDAKWCGDFHMTEKDIRKFFKKADIHADDRFYADTYGNPCYIAGEIVQENKITPFRIYGSKTGILNPGKKNEIKLWCPHCGKPFFDF